MDDMNINNLESDEITKEEILLSEEDILKGILECAEDKTADDSYTWIEVRKQEINGKKYRRVVKYDDTPLPIEKNEKILIRFRVRGLDESEYHKCRDDATRYVRNKNLGGLKMPEETNTVRFHDLMIYTATHPEDKKTVWDNKAAWKQLGIITGVDMVNKALLAGEKDAIIEIIDNKSGYDSSLEEVVKK